MAVLATNLPGLVTIRVPGHNFDKKDRQAMRRLLIILFAATIANATGATTTEHESVES